MKPDTKGVQFVIISDEIVEGIFIDESKNRFLCSVLIGDEVFECYVPSASKLKNYLNLKGKKVLLVKNRGKNTRTIYSLFAVRYYSKYIILNLLIANDVVKDYLKDTYCGYEIINEKYIGEYKSDFLVRGKSNIVIEVKGIISTRKEVVFPTVYSSRAVIQLEHIYNILTIGWKVQYFYISLSPIVREVTINCENDFDEYYRLLAKCIEKGMEIKGFNVYYKDGEIKIGEEMKVLL